MLKKLLTWKINSNFKKNTCSSGFAGWCYKSHTDKKVNDPSKTRNNVHVDFNDRTLDNVRFVKVNSLFAMREQFTPKFYVDSSIHEPTLVWNIQIDDLEKKS